MRTVGIIGLGLIGGSMAIDLKRRGFAQKVLGVERDSIAAEAAKTIGLVDEVVNYDACIQGADILVVAVPVSAAVKMVPDILDRMSPEQIVIDVCSTKSQVCHATQYHPLRGRFVSTHPMAGTEYSGPWAAQPGLFDGRACIFANSEESSPEALKTLTVSAMVTMAATILFMMPPLKKFYKEDRYPSVFPFYRRSFAAILAGLVCFVMAFLQFRPHLDGETAFKTMAVSVTQTPDSFTGLLASLRDTMGIWAAMMNYGLSFAEGTTWYALTKAALIALPYGVLGAHFGIILGVLTLPGRSVKALMGKQHWIKTDRGVIKRYWKTVALPIFLIGFFGAGVYYGYPYYVKYQDKIILTAGTSEKAGKIDVIESQYYKTGTVKSIENEKTHAVNRLKGLINNAVNEVNIVFSEEEERLETFIAWFTEERKTRRFPVGNELLKETYKNSMDLRNLNLKLQNIRKELGQEASRVYSDLGIYIDTLMKNNVITISDDDEKNIGRKFSMEEINTMKLPG